MRAPSQQPPAVAQKGQLVNLHLRPARSSAADHASIEPAVALLDKRGIVSFSSPAMVGLFHCSQEQLEGLEVARLLPGLPFKKRTPGYNLAFAESWEHEALWRKLTGLSPCGGSILLEISLKKMKVGRDDYILLGMLPATEDFSPTEELRRLIDSARPRKDSVMITDTAGIVHFINATLEASTGYRRKEIVGQHASMIKPDLHDAELRSGMWEALLAGKDFRTILTNRRKTGEFYHEDSHIRPFIDSRGVTTHFVITGRGLSEPLQRTLLRLQREAYHDALTTLPNRNLFMDRLQQSLSRSARRGEKLALIFVDLDNFKAINDTFGHAAGDAVLRAAANSLNASVRDEDTVARLGGDEFALLLPNIYRHDDIERVVNKILSSLALGVRFENRHIPIHASFGASIYPGDSTSGEPLLKQADCAMYKAKSGGGNRLRFFSDSELPDAASEPTP